MLMNEYAIISPPRAPDPIRCKTQPNPQCLAGPTKGPSFLNGLNAVYAQGWLDASVCQRLASEDRRH
jgi:hypothetical protein